MIPRVLTAMLLGALLGSASQALAQACDWSFVFPLPEVDGTILDMVVFDEDLTGPKPPALYIAGNFTFTLNDETFRNVARWDPAGGWFSMQGGMSATVSALQVFDVDGSGSGLPRLYAGGSFLTMNISFLGGQPARHMARWNGAAWETVGPDPDGVDGSVACLTVFDVDGTGSLLPALIAGGTFSQAGVAPASKVARFGIIGGSQSWAVLPGNPQMNNSVNDLVVYTEDAGLVGTPRLFAGGLFTGPGSTPPYLARYTGSAWQQVGPTGASGTNDVVNSLTVFDGYLYVGGKFTVAGGIQNVGRIAKWSGVAWSRVSNPGMNNDVNILRALDIDGASGPIAPMLYAGGVFTTAGGVSAEHVACWNGTVWSALGDGRWYPVNALADRGTYSTFLPGVFVGGGGGGEFADIWRWDCVLEPVVGDIDGDFDLDHDDFLRFEACMAGPGITTPPPGCTADEFDRADLQGNDGDVDLRDFKIFQPLFPS